jgi:hypothetical protein
MIRSIPTEDTKFVFLYSRARSDFTMPVFVKPLLCAFDHVTHQDTSG